MASRSLAVKMRLALLLAAALGVHADVQAPDMDPERKAEIAKKVREFQEMTRQNPALARPNITNNEEIDEASISAPSPRPTASTTPSTTR